MTTNTIKKVAIIIKKSDKKTTSLVNRVIETLYNNRLEIFIIHPLEHKLAKTILSIKELNQIEIDMAISIGGDGTLLRLVRDLEKEIPILGINSGGKGIITEIIPEQIVDACRNIINKNYILESRIRLKCTIGKQQFEPVLNEVYFIRTEITKTPYYKVKLNGKEILNNRMDGLVIATPTGSTGHSLSLGGPVLVEDDENILITPIGSVSNIPSIVSKSKEIEVASDNEMIIVLDGQQKYKIKQNKSIVIKRNKFNAILMRFDSTMLKQMKKMIK